MTPATETLIPPDGPIDIDARTIEALRREMDGQARQPWEMRLMVEALERRNRAQGAGWSRPWNRTGMAVFRVERVLPALDQPGWDAAVRVIRDFAPEPLLTLAFIDDLFADAELAAFVFYHNRESGGAQYEGLTLSFGRPAPDEHARLDRLDLILEDRRVDGRVDGRVDLARIIVCPWSGYGLDRDYHRIDLCEPSAAGKDGFDEVYREWVAAYRARRDGEGRRWTHWLAEYSSMFAGRSFVPGGTSFPWP